jgi:hypothetical protein
VSGVQSLRSQLTVYSIPTLIQVGDNDTVSLRCSVNSQLILHVQLFPFEQVEKVQNEIFKGKKDAKVIVCELWRALPDCDLTQLQCPELSTDLPSATTRTLKSCVDFHIAL